MIVAVFVPVFAIVAISQRTRAKFHRFLNRICILYSTSSSGILSVHRVHVGAHPVLDAGLPYVFTSSSVRMISVLLEERNESVYGLPVH